MGLQGFGLLYLLGFVAFFVGGSRLELRRDFRRSISTTRTLYGFLSFPLFLLPFPLLQVLRQGIPSCIAGVYPYLEEEGALEGACLAPGEPEYVIPSCGIYRYLYAASQKLQGDTGNIHIPIFYFPFSLIMVLSP